MPYMQTATTEYQYRVQDLFKFLQLTVHVWNICPFTIIDLKCELSIFVRTKLSKNKFNILCREETISKANYVEYNAKNKYLLMITIPYTPNT